MIRARLTYTPVEDTHFERKKGIDPQGLVCPECFATRMKMQNEQQSHTPVDLQPAAALYGSITRRQFAGECVRGKHKRDN
jgi:hypothetical protein